MNSLHLELTYDNANNLNIIADETLYGQLDTHKSNGGISYILVKSPLIIVILLIRWIGIRFFNSETILGSISIAMTWAATSANYNVKLPLPGPISKTTSLGLILDFSTIVFIIFGLVSKC